MTISSDQAARRADASGPTALWPVRILVEIAMGLGFALVLIIVAWASSNAIRFVYGGY
jgi:hypothetical protein